MKKEYMTSEEIGLIGMRLFRNAMDLTGTMNEASMALSSALLFANVTAAKLSGDVDINKNKGLDEKINFLKEAMKNVG